MARRLIRNLVKDKSVEDLNQLQQMFPLAVSQKVVFIYLFILFYLFLVYFTIVLNISYNITKTTKLDIFVIYKKMAKKYNLNIKNI